MRQKHTQKHTNTDTHELSTQWRLKPEPKRMNLTHCFRLFGISKEESSRKELSKLSKEELKGWLLWCYKEAMKKYHPDKNGGSKKHDEKCRRFTEARDWGIKYLDKRILPPENKFENERKAIFKRQKRARLTKYNAAIALCEELGWKKGSQALAAEKFGIPRSTLNQAIKKIRQKRDTNTTCQNGSE